MVINNETVGISAEVAIANVFGLIVNPKYVARANQAIVNSICPIAGSIFSKNNIPRPVQHITEDQNPVDFILQNNMTLSVKSNQGNLGKVVGLGTTECENIFRFNGK